MRVLFSTFVHWPGVVSCLNNIKSIVRDKYPDATILERNFEAPNISFSLIKEIKSNPPDVLFIGGWDNRVKTIVQNTLPKTKVVLMWCSPVTQIELGGEISRFFDVWNLLETNVIDVLGIPLETDYESLKILNDRVKYFPIYMDVSELEGIEKQDCQTEKFVTDIFCAPCSRKNIITQMFAVAHHKDKIKMHLNYSPSPNNNLYIDTAHRIIGDYENFGWLERREYLRKIRLSNFGMQVSLSESFDYVAAEHMYFKIPVILSNIIPYASDPRINSLVVKNHQNIYEISRIISKLLDKSFCEDMGEISKKVIEEHIENSKFELSSSLNSILKG